MVLLALWIALAGASTWVMLRFSNTPLGQADWGLQTSHNFVTTATLLGRPGAALTHRLINIEPVTYFCLTSVVGWGLWFAALLATLVLRDEAHRQWLERTAIHNHANGGAPGQQEEIRHALDGQTARPSDAALHAALSPNAARSLSRRELLTDVGIACSGALACGALYKACAVDAWNVQTRQYRVAIADLPPSLRGLRIVQLSDTHLGLRVHEGFLHRCVQLALDLEPDVIALTGDYIHNGTTVINDAAAVFEPLFASLHSSRGRPIPIVGVLGNHDWYGDGPLMSRALASRGVKMIDNARVYLDAATRELVQSAPAQGLCLAGLGDYLEDTIRPDLALNGVPESMPRILLSHNPDTAEDPLLIYPNRRVDLQISGHTHGGQVRLPLLGTPIIPSRFGRKYAGGLVQGPVFPVVISRGIGTSGLPLRWNVPAEVVVIELA